MTSKKNKTVDYNLLTLKSGDLLTVKDAAGYCRVSAELMRRWIRAGIVKAFPCPSQGKGIRQMYRVFASSIMELLGIDSQSGMKG